MDEVKKNGYIKQIIKGLLSSVIIALICVLTFAFIVKFAMLNSGIVKAVNQFIKILSVFLGCVFCVREKAGLIKGGFIGLFFSILIYLIFAIIGTKISFGASFFLDIVLTSLIGGVSGIIAVNMKK